MAKTVLNTTDVFEWEGASRPGWPVALPGGTASLGAFSQRVHPKAGSFAFRNLGWPHLHVTEMRWHAPEAIELHDPIPSETVNINFMLEGSIDSQFRGLSQPLVMRPQTHNMVYTNEADHINWLKGGQALSSLLISLDKDFFVASIGDGDAWSERVTADLYHGRPFAGGRNARGITPQMRYLIHDIQHNTASGPMYKLLIQSRVLELVALEIEQFRTPAAAVETIPADEIEKLHRLKAYLEANFLLEHSLAQLSRYCLLNEFKVKKGFRQLFDTTVFNYLRKLRMDYAGRLLRNSAVSVDEVADQLGYEHPQHFSIAFKKHTGLTPSQFQHGRPAA